MAQATFSCPFGAIHLEDRRGTAQDGHSVSIFALPPVPHYGGRVLARFSNISGAQNLSGFYRFIPGHWALGLQKLPLLRFMNCAWLCRANASGPFPTVGAAISRPQSLPPSRGKVGWPLGQTDEGDLLRCGTFPAGAPRGSPTKN